MRSLTNVAAGEAAFEHDRDVGPEQFGRIADVMHADLVVAFGHDEVHASVGSLYGARLHEAFEAEPAFAERCPLCDGFVDGLEIDGCVLQALPQQPTGHAEGDEQQNGAALALHDRGSSSGDGRRSTERSRVITQPA